MALDEWRYLLFDMKTFSVIAELSEVGDPQITEVINSSGSAQVTIPFGPAFGFVDQTDYGFGYVDIKMPRAGLAVEHNGVLEFAGPVSVETFNFSSGGLDLSANGIFEIFKRRVSFTNHNFVPTTAQTPWVPSAYVGIGWDQAWIVKHYIDKMQEQDHGYLNIANDFQTTGVFRTHHSFAVDLKTYADILHDRSSLVNGFDFKFTPRWKNGIRNEEIEWVFEIFYPPEGRETGLLFELGSNVDFQQLQVNGSQIVFGAYSIMENSGNVANVGFDENSAQRAADYRLEAVDREHTDVKSVTTANNYARITRLQRSKESSVPTIVAPIALADEFIVGDKVKIKASWGLVQFVPYIEARIMNFTLRPKSGTVEINVAPIVTSSGVG